jgi:hypothetical protein
MQYIRMIILDHKTRLLALEENDGKNGESTRGH